MIITPTILTTLVIGTLYTVKWSTLQHYPDFIKVTAIGVVDNTGTLNANVSYFDSTGLILQKTALIDQANTAWLIDLTK
jgi:hypothetical protein